MKIYSLEVLKPAARNVAKSMGDASFLKKVIDLEGGGACHGHTSHRFCIRFGNRAFKNARCSKVSRFDAFKTQEVSRFQDCKIWHGTTS